MPVTLTKTTYVIAFSYALKMIMTPLTIAIFNRNSTAYFLKSTSEQNKNSMMGIIAETYITTIFFTLLSLGLIFYFYTNSVKVDMTLYYIMFAVFMIDMFTTYALTYVIISITFKKIASNDSFDFDRKQKLAIIIFNNIFYKITAIITLLPLNIIYCKLILDSI